MQQYAADGITFDSLEARTDLFLATGNRKDAMIEMPSTEGTYCLVAEGAAPPGGPPPSDVIAVVEVHTSAGTATGALPSNSDLASVAPPLLDCSGTADGTQDVIFAQALDAQGQPCESPLNIDCRSFDANDPRVLSVDTIDEWTVDTEGGPHPMHIHVNPFTVCDATENGQALRPQWRDTMLITGETRMRMSYDRFTGSFVMHCHKLHHEDGGMMELVRIDP